MTLSISEQCHHEEAVQWLNTLAQAWQPTAAQSGVGADKPNLYVAAARSCRHVSRRTVAAGSSSQPAAQPRGCLACVPVERFAWQQSKLKKTCNSSLCLSLQRPAGCCQDIAGTIPQPRMALG